MTDERPSAHDHRTADWFREAWSQALVTLGAAEEEASKLLHKVGDLAGWKPEDAKRLAQEFGERLVSQRKEFEHTLDERINRALSRIKLPKREEIAALGKRVAAIADRVGTLEGKK